MAISQRGRQSKKVSGGTYKSPRAKKKYELGRVPTNTSIAEKDARKELRGMGGNKKTILLNASTVNLFNPKTKKFEKAKLAKVTECPANLNYVRRNILTKGTIVETDKGKARLTSRPGQNGSLNAVLI
ncbi:30S ribosomal protein S8e [Candidatus Woesearchaeota archaeon]|nr:30S ribosomal protein S8e [Candidatus Woesearchaeota archaeon]